MLFFLMNLMRRIYMYTQTSSVSSIVAKKGPKIAVCAMFLFLGDRLQFDYSSHTEETE